MLRLCTENAFRFMMQHFDIKESHNPFAATIVFVTFALLIPVLLVNMLIAKMARTYEKIKDRSRMEWKRQVSKNRTPLLPGGSLAFQLVYHPRPWKRGKRVFFRHLRRDTRVSHLGYQNRPKWEEKRSVFVLEILKRVVKENDARNCMIPK